MGNMFGALLDINNALKVHELHYCEKLFYRIAGNFRHFGQFHHLLTLAKILQIVESAALLTNRGVIHQFIGDLVNAMRDYKKAVSV